MERLEALAVDGHSIRRCEELQRRVAKGCVGKHDVAFIRLAKSHSNAVDEGDFGPLVGALHYLQQKTHSLSLPSGWMLISALSSWNDSTGSS